MKDEDVRIEAKLKEQHLMLDSVPAVGETIPLLDNANLSTGGDAKDVINDMHPAFTQIAKDIAQTMGLRLCGIDLMVEEGIHNEPRNYWVIEVNSTPGIGNFAKSGEKQNEQVDAIYRRIMQRLEQDTEPKT